MKIATLFLALGIFSGIAAFLFWWIEAKWKTFQYSNSLRIRQIEGYFRGDKDKVDMKPFQIYNSWFKSYAKGLDPHVDQVENRTPRQKTFSNAKLSMVYTPYLYIVIIDFGLLMWELIKTI